MDVHKCDHPERMTDFDAKAYMGIWYEQQHSKDLFYGPDNGVCTYAYYFNLQTDGYFDVLNSG